MCVIPSSRQGRVREVSMPEIFVCREGELPENKVRLVGIQDLEIGVYHHQGNYYAYRNHCVHQGGPACEGMLLPKVRDVIADDRTWRGQTFDEDEMHIVCPWHGYEFKLKDGNCATDPKLRLKRFDVVSRDGGIYVVV
jgi:nitrite reductase/ring-hydroxylating ferredoxin subunit